MDPRWLVARGEKLPETIEFPTPRLPREQQQAQFLRDLEIDPKLYYPTGLFREPTVKWPGVKLNVREMLKAKGVDPNDYEFK
jgi:ribonuclease Z